jgi:Ca2+-binding RTX toxin-like protein
MPTTALFTNTDGNITLATSENYLLGEGITHYRTSNGNVLTVGGTGENDIVVNGTMTTLGSGELIRVASGSTNGVTITVGVTGSLIGSSNFRAISANGDFTVVANNGLITGGEAIILNGENSTVQNTGTIQNTFSSNAFQAYAIQMNDIGATIMNSGDISGPRGVRMTSGGDLTNSGSIAATGNAVVIDSLSNAYELVNTGIISSTQGDAILGGNSTQDISNSGTITGDVVLAGGDDIIKNSGTIAGDIAFTSGANFVSNSGIIDGILTFGMNADIYQAQASGFVSGGVFGGAGNDTLRGGNEDDILNGGDDNDLLTGNSGEDTLNGEDGADVIRGGGDNDLIDGGLGDDNLRGDGGDDTIYGGADDDKIFGGAGADEIIGGTGKDVMRGNGGADTFVFLTEFDANTTTAIDRIRDFEQGVDKIDISAIAGFEFIGDSSFSGTGSEVRYQTTASGLRFEMDVDGDGTADMRINVNSLSDLLESDFIL